MKNMIKWFNNLPTELKGGCIALCVQFLSFVLAIYLDFFSIIAFPISFLAWRFIWGDNTPPEFLGILVVILNYVFLFTIGAILGRITRGNKNAQRIVLIAIFILYLAFALWAFLDKADFYQLPLFQSQEQIQDKKFSQAVNALDDQRCKELKDQNAVDWCIELVARSKKDLSICEKISDDFGRDGCYWVINEMDYLPNRENKSLYEKWCPTFKSDFYKEECSNILNPHSN